ncbi:MAG: type II toxin-antitoxin system VapC family toxin [Anaerolineae bacterium]|nr:type II toxin-antitoxin system VapC family toxin [Anaerolineae bacterium]
MTYLLDTNVCIKHLNGQSESIRQHLVAAQPQDIVLCSVVRAELFYGALKSRQSIQNITRIREFIDRFVSLAFDDRAAEYYGQIRVQVEQQGTPIGPNDMMIAAIAVAYQVTLITHNTREFDRVPGLRWEDWEASP